MYVGFRDAGRVSGASSEVGGMSQAVVKEGRAEQDGDRSRRNDRTIEEKLQMINVLNLLKIKLNARQIDVDKDSMNQIISKIQEGSQQEIQEKVVLVSCYQLVRPLVN